MAARPAGGGGSGRIQDFEKGGQRGCALSHTKRGSLKLPMYKEVNFLPIA